MNGALKESDKKLLKRYHVDLSKYRILENDKYHMVLVSFRGRRRTINKANGLY